MHPGEERLLRLALLLDGWHPLTNMLLDGKKENEEANQQAIVVGEQHAFSGNSIDISRLVAYQAMRVDANVRLADIVTENHENVWFSSLRQHRGGPQNKQSWNNPSHSSS